jgi:hypothetical protein
MTCAQLEAASNRIMTCAQLEAASNRIMTYAQLEAAALAGSSRPNLHGR